MYQGLIAYDEPKIRLHLQQWIPWEELDCHVAGFSEDGKQALAFVRENPVDICLVDICMPFLNGLELIEALHAENEDLLCLIISGHDEFEYAQKSIELHVFQYLLKPVSAARLQEAIESATQELQQRMAKKLEFERALKLNDMSVGALREEFLSRLAQGLLTQDELEEEIWLLSLSGNAQYCLGIMTSDEQAIGVTVRERQLYRLHLQKDLKKLCPGEWITSFDVYDNLLAFVNIPPQDGARMDDVQRQYPAMTVYRGIRLREVSHRYEEWMETRQTQTAPLALEAMNRIDQHYSEETFDMARLAEMLHVSCGCLGRLLRRQTGMTFNEYLTQTRIRVATALLSQTDLKMFEIADRVGYSSQHYFCTVFKRAVGLAPSEYRSMGGNKFGAD